MSYSTEFVNFIFKIERRQNTNNQFYAKHTHGIMVAAAPQPLASPDLLWTKDMERLVHEKDN